MGIENRSIGLQPPRKSAMTSIASFEAETYRKVDVRIVPFLFLCYIDTEHPTKMVEPCIFGRVESCDLVGIINLLSVITCKIRIILDKSYARSARSLGGSDRSRAATVWTSRYAVNGLRREEAVSDFNEISH